MAADGLPIGMTPLNTGDVLLGSVLVTPVLFESDGSIDPESQQWTEEEIQETLALVDEGVHWWSRTLDALDTVHTLDFVIDDSFALDPVKTGYEPIDHSSQIFNEYVGAFLTDQGFGDAPSIERATQLFNHQQRSLHGTDWAFTIFIIDSSDDPDGLFKPGSFSGAFAYPGGLFMVTPSTRPASTIAHEMGHIFWARDEYPDAASYTDRRGYYNSPVLNAADNPDPGFVQQDSIMRGGAPLRAAYLSETSPASTLALVGWRDSDEDGIFDFADVPLDLEAVGYFDAPTSQFLVHGSASAVPLQNKNSAGVQSDITLNRISELQYRVDSGVWMTAAQPDQQVVDFDLAIPIGSDFSTIEFRAIDQQIGVTSEIISVSPLSPATSHSSISGYAFVDENGNGTRDSGEPLMSHAQAVVRRTDGFTLFGGHYAATDFELGEIDVATPGVQLSAAGLLMASGLGSLESIDSGGKRVFQGFNTRTDRWQDRWSDRSMFVADFDENVGEVGLSITGLDEGSYARIEAYDRGGQLIRRLTSDWIAGGDTQSMSIHDPQGRIASIRAYGHAETSIAIDDLHFGFSDSVLTDASGVWQFKNLPDGQYRVDLIADKLIHQFSQPSLEIIVLGGNSEMVAAVANRVTSPRHNPVVAEDVGGDGEVTSRDALLVINDINRFGARQLGPHEIDGDWIDVNNDGAVSGLDALLVINSLQRQNLEAEQQSTSQSRGGVHDAAIAGWTNPAEELVDSLAGSPMFNSAGRDSDDESAAVIPADTTIEAPGEQTIVSAGADPDQEKTDPNLTDSSQIPAKTGESAARTIDKIASEILEPLIQTEV
jgi:hypothetical protein